MADRGFVIDLPIRERWQVVDVLRTAVFQCLAVVFDGESFAELVSMVVGELAENALKHGASTGDAEAKPAGESRLRLSGGPSGVEVEVTNPLPEGSVPLVLFSMLDRIRAAATPQDAYVERLREVARDASIRGGLGLLRIAYEASASLTASIDGNRLTVRARMDAPPAESAEGFARQH